MVSAPFDGPLGVRWIFTLVTPGVAFAAMALNGASSATTVIAVMMHVRRLTMRAK
jgi:hypothetical protein